MLRIVDLPAQEVHLEGDGTSVCQDGGCHGRRHRFVVACSTLALVADRVELTGSLEAV
jgi:hypothetical protein